MACNEGQSTSSLYSIFLIAAVDCCVGPSEIKSTRLKPRWFQLFFSHPEGVQRINSNWIGAHLRMNTLGTHQAPNICKAAWEWSLCVYLGGEKQAPPTPTAPHLLKDPTEKSWMAVQCGPPSPALVRGLFMSPSNLRGQGLNDVAIMVNEYSLEEWQSWHVLQTDWWCRQDFALHIIKRFCLSESVKLLHELAFV